MNRRASRILTVCAGAWLLVIWGHSCLPAAQSGAESGALLVVVQDLLPRMTDHVLRKCAHFAEYAVLGALTAAALRTACGAERPMEILPCVWIVSVYSLTVAVTAAKLMARFSRRRDPRADN